MWTVNHIVYVCLCLFSHKANAVPADVVLAARRHEYRVKIPQTNRTVEPVNLLFLLFNRVIVTKENIFFVHSRPDSYFVPGSNFLELLFVPLYLIQLRVQSEDLMIVFNLWVQVESRCIRESFKVGWEVSVLLLLLSMLWAWIARPIALRVVLIEDFGLQLITFIHLFLAVISFLTKSLWFIPLLIKFSSFGGFCCIIGGLFLSCKDLLVRMYFQRILHSIETLTRCDWFSGGSSQARLPLLSWCFSREPLPMLPWPFPYRVLPS